MNKLFPFAIWPNNTKLKKSEQSPEDYEAFVQKIIKEYTRHHGPLAKEDIDSIRKVLGHPDLQNPEAQQALASNIIGTTLQTHGIGSSRFGPRGSDFERSFDGSYSRPIQFGLNYLHPAVEGLRDIHYKLGDVTPPLFPDDIIEHIKKIKGVNLEPEGEARIRDAVEGLPRPTHPNQLYMKQLITAGFPEDRISSVFAQNFPGFEEIQNSYLTARKMGRTINPNDTNSQSFYLGTKGRNGENISGLQFIPSHKDINGNVAWKVAIHSPRTLLPEHAKGGLEIPLHTQRLGTVMSFIKIAADRFNHPGLEKVADSMAQSYASGMRLDYGSHSNPDDWAAHIAPQLVNRPGVLTRIMTSMNPQNRLEIDSKIRNAHAARQQRGMRPPE